MPSLRRKRATRSTTPGSLTPLRRVLAVADDVLIPVEPESLAFEPAYNTIEKVIKPRGLPYLTFVNNWEPRDGTKEQDETIEFVERTDGRWPGQWSAITRCTRVPPLTGSLSLGTRGTGPASKLAEDYYRLALEFERMQKERAAA